MEARKYGRVCIFRANIAGSVKKVKEWITIGTISPGYQPEFSISENYVSQTGKPMLITIQGKRTENQGRVDIMIPSSDFNPIANEFFLRKSIVYYID